MCVSFIKPRCTFPTLPLFGSSVKPPRLPEYERSPQSLVCLNLETTFHKFCIQENMERKLYITLKLTQKRNVVNNSFLYLIVLLYLFNAFSEGIESLFATTGKCHSE